MNKSNLDEILKAYDVMKYSFEYINNRWYMSCDAKCSKCKFHELVRQTKGSCFDFSNILYKYFKENNLHSEYWI